MFKLIILLDVQNSQPQYGSVEKRIQKLPDLSRIHFWGIKMADGEHWKIKDRVQTVVERELATRLLPAYIRARNNVNIPHDDQPPVLVATLPNEVQPDANTFVFQFVLNPDFQVDVSFLSHSSAGVSQLESNQILSKFSSISGTAITEKLTKAQKDFETKFKENWKLSTDQTTETKFGQAVLGNLLGGIGYLSFYLFTFFWFLFLFL